MSVYYHAIGPNILSNKQFYDKYLKPDDYEQIANELALSAHDIQRFPGFFYTRHGQTDSNVKNLCAGGDSNGQLTAQGKAQASSLSPITKQLSPFISAIFSSAKGRAIHTAHLMNRDAQLDVRANKHIIEKYFGSWDGRHHGRPAYPYRQKSIVEAIMSGEAPKDAETPLAAAQRFGKGLRDIFGKSAGYGTDKAPLLVAHAGIIQYYTAQFNVRWPAGDDTQYANIKNSTVYFFEFCNDHIREKNDYHRLLWRCWALAQPGRPDHQDLIHGRDVGDQPVWVQVNWEPLNPKIGMHHTPPKLDSNTELPPYLAQAGFQLAGFQLTR